MTRYPQETIHVASAPVSWGVMEETDQSVWPPAARVMAEISAAGYEGTELGPYGYYPTEAIALQGALHRNGLTLTSAFVPLRWFQPERLPADAQALMQVARLLNALDCPFIVVADGITPAGEPSPSDAAWKVTATTMERLARELGGLGLRLVFHLETGSHLATPDDEERLCSLTDPDWVGICLDTGHYAYSYGNPRYALRRHANRIRYVHLKDVDAAVRDHAHRDSLDFYSAVRAGLFTPLGKGCADIAGVIADLQSNRFRGWVVAEQDVLMPQDSGNSPLHNARVSRDFLREHGI